MAINFQTKTGHKLLSVRKISTNLVSDKNNVIIKWVLEPCQINVLIQNTIEGTDNKNKVFIKLNKSKPYQNYSLLQNFLSSKSGLPRVAHNSKSIQVE